MDMNKNDTSSTGATLFDIGREDFRFADFLQIFGQWLVTTGDAVAFLGQFIALEEEKIEQVKEQKLNQQQEQQRQQIQRQLEQMQEQINNLQARMRE